MALQFDLSLQEARLLAIHLERHLQRLDAELVRTDKHELQHALALEISELQGIEDRLRNIVPSGVADAE